MAQKDEDKYVNMNGTQYPTQPGLMDQAKELTLNPDDRIKLAALRRSRQAASGQEVQAGDDF